MQDNERQNIKREDAEEKERINILRENEVRDTDETMQLTGIDAVNREWILIRTGENKYAHNIEMPGKIQSSVRQWMQFKIQNE